MKQSQFGIKPHAQLQTIEGHEFEFQPEHLLCDECWNSADSAFSMACYYGACRSGAKDAFMENYHGMTVTKLSHSRPTTRFPN